MGTNDGRFFFCAWQEAHILILELCEKGELFDVLMFDEDDPVSPVVCKEYFRQLMRGIKFCHGTFLLLHQICVLQLLCQGHAFPWLESSLIPEEYPQVRAAVIFVDWPV